MLTGASRTGSAASIWASGRARVTAASSSRACEGTAAAGGDVAVDRAHVAGHVGPSLVELHAPTPEFARHAIRFTSGTWSSPKSCPSGGIGGPDDESHFGIVDHRVLRVATGQGSGVSPNDRQSARRNRDHGPPDGLARDAAQAIRHRRLATAVPGRSGSADLVNEFPVRGVFRSRGRSQSRHGILRGWDSPRLNTFASQTRRSAGRGRAPAPTRRTAPRHPTDPGARERAATSVP